MLFTKQLHEWLENCAKSIEIERQFRRVESPGNAQRMEGSSEKKKEKYIKQ